MPGSGDQGAQHCRELQDLLFIKSLLSRAEDIPNFLNIQTDTKRQTKRGGDREIYAK